MTLPESIESILRRAKHDPDAYRELTADHFVREPSGAQRAGVGTNAWSAGSATLPSKPAALLALGEERVRGLVRSERLLQAVLGWSGGSLVLCGPTGEGKTAALVLLCLKHNPPGWRWVDGVPLGESSRRTPLGQGQPELIAMACRARVLIVDDPDHAKDREPFLEVLRYRYNEQRPTLVATGKSEEELEQHIGDAYFRRIQESGADCNVVDLWKPEPKSEGGET